jgi:hypothetical protein
VPTPVVSSPVKTVNNDEEPILYEPIQIDATDEGEQQRPQTEDVPNVEAPKRSQRVRNQLFLMIMRCITLKNFKWRVIPLHLKKP